jgi:hypothetical protein
MKSLDLDAQKYKLKTEIKGEEGAKMKKYEMQVDVAQERFDDECECIRQYVLTYSFLISLGCWRR